MPRTQTRKHRVGAEIQRLLNELLLSDAKDPRLEGARVSDVEVSGDLGLATVYFSLIDPEEDPAEAKEGFERARGFLRSRVGEALQLRRVPELRFRHDTSAEQAVELGRLIDQAQPRRPSESSD